MVEFKIKVNPDQHVAYIPKEIYEALGPNLTAVANRAAILVYSEGTTPENAIKSIEIIKADLQHAVDIKKQKETPKT